MYRLRIRYANLEKGAKKIVICTDYQDTFGLTRMLSAFSTPPPIGLQFYLYVFHIIPRPFF